MTIRWQEVKRYSQREPGMFRGCLGDWYTGLDTQISLFRFCFVSCISTKKYVEVATNDFTTHLLISKWFERQKCMQKRWVNETKKHRSKKRIGLRKFFHLFKFVTDYANVRFFSFRTCSKSLNDVNCLHCFVWFLLYYLLHIFSSDYFAAITSL